MANTVIEPTFFTDADRLTFLSRLWGITVVAQDVVEWAVYKALRPTSKSDLETHHQFYEREQAWNDGRLARPAFFVLSKWDSYRCGKVKPEAEKYLGTQPNPNRTQARQAALLQFTEKFADRLVLVNANQDLLPLVTGIVW